MEPTESQRSRHRTTLTVAGWLFVLVLSAVLTAPPGFLSQQVPAAGDASLRLLSPDLNVVAVKVKHVDKAGKGIVKITHVFYGNGDLRGRSFIARSYRGREQGKRAMLEPFLRRGEEGLWVVTKRKGQIQCTQCNFFGVWTPTREGQDSRYSQALKIATTLNQAAAADAAERRNILKGGARDPDPKVAAASVRILGVLMSDASWDGFAWPSSPFGVPRQAAEDRGEAEVFLLSLAADQALPAPVKVAVDESLTAISGQRWQQSGARRDMFRKWVSSGMSERASGPLIGRLHRIASYVEMEEGDLVHLLREGSSSGGSDLTVRKRFFWVAKEALDFLESDAAVFSFLVDCIKNSTEEEIRAAAARCLEESRTLSTRERWDAIVELRDSVEDRALRATLQKALNNMRERKDKPRQRMRAILESF